MKYSEKYDLYIDDDFVIYYWDKKLDKLMQSTIHNNKFGYLYVYTKIGTRCVHRVIYETFIGEIPDGYEIDHINTIRTDNRLENLRCVTHKENMNNPLSLKHRSEAMKGKKLSEEAKRKIGESKKGNTYGKGNKSNTGKTFSEFGRKFKDRYGVTKNQNPKLYNKEQAWYHRHNNKCRWE